MKTERISDEVLYSRDPLTLLDADGVRELKNLAGQSGRDGIRICAHKDPADPVHDMIIYQARGRYSVPHLHQGKEESLHVIKGQAALFLFEPDGRVRGVEMLGPYDSGLTFFCRVPAGLYHCLLILSDEFVFHECAQGPFDRSLFVQAPFAPDPGDKDESDRFMSNLAAILRQRQGEGR